MAEASHVSYGTEKNILMPEVAAKYKTAQSCIKVINNRTHVADTPEGMHSAEWAALFQHAIKNPLDFTVVFAEKNQVNIEFDEMFTEGELKAMSITKLAKIYQKLGGRLDVSGKKAHIDAILDLQNEQERLNDQARRMMAAEGDKLEEKSDEITPE